MATRVVEGKKPYTGGEAIDIDQNKVISLKLRDENNLIIYDSGDDEIYVDLQLPDGITPTDAFPVGVTTGRVVVADGWDLAGTIICAKTTSGDNIKLLYADDGTLWIDNGTGTFKQIYFKADVDALITTLTTYINAELAKKQNGVVSSTAPSNPSEGDLWYDTTNSAMKVWDGTAWQSVGTGGGSDIEYVTQVEYDALPSSKLTDGKHYVIYTSDSPTPPSPGRLPAEYQEVEYIQSTGTQRINTGIKPTQDHGFECKFNLTAASGDWNIMMTSDGSYDYRYGFGAYNLDTWQVGDGVTRLPYYGTGVSPQLNVDTVSLYNVNNSHKWNVDGVDVYTFQTIGTIPYSLTWNIFCQTLGSDTTFVRYGSYKLYYMKINDGATLVRDFVPCYRKADGEIGLYDLVDDAFYTNDGTGTFTKGPDAN